MSWMQKNLPTFCGLFQRSAKAAAHTSLKPSPPGRDPNGKNQIGSRLEPPKKRVPLTAAQQDY